MLPIVIALTAHAHAADSQIAFDAPQGMIIAEQTGSVTGYASTSAGGMSYGFVELEDRCTAPCSVDAEAGFRTFVAYGKGWASTSAKVELKPDTRYVATVRAKPSWMRATGYGLVVTGLTGAITFGTFAALQAGDPALFDYPWAVPATIGSTAAMAGGVGLGIAGRSRMDVAPAGGLPAPTMELRGAF